MEYLGHIINEERVSTDQSKVEAMRACSLPKTLKELRGFLVLTGYYKKFIKGYSMISKPLINSLNKGEFMWTSKSTRALNQLKEAMSNVLLLALPNFNKNFYVGSRC